MSEEVRNAAERLRKLLRAAQYPQLAALRLEDGDVAELLRVLHFVLLDSSRAVAQFLVDRGYDLYGKTDARFVESAFRLLRDEFRCFPSLSASQFLSRQFVARRLAIVADAAAAVAQKRQELQRQKRRDEAVWSQPQQGRRRDAKPQVENHVLPAAVTNHAASILQHLNAQQTDSRRRTRRTSSESPRRPSGLERDREPVTAPPAPVFAKQQAAVKFANEGRRTSDQEFAGNDVPATDYPQQKPCGCSQGSTELTKAISDLSRQLSQMSSALIGKISSVEDRLGRLESQVHDVWTAVEEQGEMARKSSSAHASIAADNASRSDGEQPSPADVNKRRTLDVETPCAWPPQPSVFERY